MEMYHLEPLEREAALFCLWAGRRWWTERIGEERPHLGFLHLLTAVGRFAAGCRQLLERGDLRHFRNAVRNVAPFVEGLRHARLNFHSAVNHKVRVACRKVVKRGGRNAGTVVGVLRLLAENMDAADPPSKDKEDGADDFKP